LIGVRPLGARAVDAAQELIESEPHLFEFTPLFKDGSQQLFVDATEVLDFTSQRHQVNRRVLHDNDLAPASRIGK